jgi:hypothetical protein
LTVTVDTRTSRLHQVAARLIKHSIGRENQISIPQSQRRQQMLAGGTGATGKKSGGSNSSSSDGGGGGSGAGGAGKKLAAFTGDGAWD